MHNIPFCIGTTICPVYQGLNKTANNSSLQYRAEYMYVRTYVYTSYVSTCVYHTYAFEAVKYGF